VKTRGMRIGMREPVIPRKKAMSSGGFRPGSPVQEVVGNPEPGPRIHAPVRMRTAPGGLGVEDLDAAIRAARSERELAAIIGANAETMRQAHRHFWRGTSPGKPETDEQREVRQLKLARAIGDARSPQELSEAFERYGQATP